MKIKFVISLVLCILLVSICALIFIGEKHENSSVKHSQFIIIKADSFMSSSDMAELQPRWKRFFEYIEEKNIKASVGIIGDVLKNNLDSSDEETKYLIDTYLKNSSKRDTFEFFSHGYTYGCGDTSTEFSNTSYEYQKESLLKTQNLAKEKLNLTIHAFSAPCNKLDKNTLKALKDTNITILFSVDRLSPDKLFMLLQTECNIEKKESSIPDYRSFVDDYSSLNCNKSDYLVLQIGPSGLDDEGFEQFTNIIDFLIEQNVTFINPYEYYQLKNK